MIKQGNLPKGWEIKSFTECIEKMPPTNKLKIQKKDYNEVGKYKIIDQGANFIAGFTNNSDKVYDGILPIIIFGDHTRIFKYVDFPFALGADGTKVLIPKDILDSKYFYYFLKSLIIEDHGYNRHYKFLKEKKIIIPPIRIQKKIVEILEKAENLKEWRTDADELTDEFLKSVFLEIFGDPIKNTRNFKIENLEKLCNKITDGEHQNPKLVSSGRYLLMAKDVRDNHVDFSQNNFVSEKDYKKFIKKCNPQKGDILLVSRGATIGRCTSINTETPFCLMGSVILIKPKLINTKYLEHLFKHENFIKNLIRLSSSSAQQAIYLKHLKKLNIPVPPIELQNQFENIVKQVETIKTHQKQSKQQIDNLSNVLMQKLFKGE